MLRAIIVATFLSLLLNAANAQGGAREVSMKSDNAEFSYFCGMDVASCVAFGVCGNVVERNCSSRNHLLVSKPLKPKTNSIFHHQALIFPSISLPQRSKCTQTSIQSELEILFLIRNREISLISSARQ
jgi:hypothetical protein